MGRNRQPKTFDMASIVIYEGSKTIEDVPNIELPYTKQVGRNGIEGLLVAAHPRALFTSYYLLLNAASGARKNLMLSPTQFTIEILRMPTRIRSIMLNKQGISEVFQQLHISFCVTHIVFFLTFWQFSMASIVIYEGSKTIEDVPNIELPYTKQVGRNGIEGLLVAAHPLHACVTISKPPDINKTSNWFVLIAGNSCTFETKILNAKLSGYAAAIIYAYSGRVESYSNHHGHYYFYSDMPSVLIKTEDGIRFKEDYLYAVNPLFKLVIFPNYSFSVMTFLLLFSIVAGLVLMVMLAFTIIRFFQQSHTVENGRLSSQHLKQLQTTTYQKGDNYETCAICLEDYKDQDKLRILPCCHDYHMKCIDPWLTNNRCICPVCKRKVILAERHSNIDSNIEDDETTPLLQPQRVDFPVTLSYVNPNASPEQLTGENSQCMTHATVPHERGYNSCK